MDRKPLVVLLTVAVAFALTLETGCVKGTPTTCNGWAKLLRSPVNGKKAIKESGELHCVDSLPILLELFPTSQFKDDILAAVRNINEPLASVELLTVALQDPDSAPQAAAVAEDFAIPELRKPLIEVLTTSDAPKARHNAINALAKIDKDNLKQHEKLFIQLLRNDPNLQGIQVNAAAARLLGEIGSEEAIPHLIMGMFIKTQRGEKMYTAARKALARIGPKVVEPLVAVQANDRSQHGPMIEELANTASRLGMNEWEWQDGPEIYQVLGDLRETSAAPAIAKSLAKPLNPPVGVDDRVTRSWQITQQNRITMAMLALWNVGSPEIIPQLKEIIVNPDNDAKLRLDTATALGMLPGYAGMPALLDIYKTSKLQTFRAPLLKPVAMGISWDELPALEKMLKADKSELVVARTTGEESGEFQSMISVLQKCAKNDVDCLIGVLKGEDIVASQKAAILLSNVKGDHSRKALDALLTFYPTVNPKETDLRRFLIIGIWRLGDKSTVKDVERLIQADKEAKGGGFWVDELEPLLFALQRR